MTAAQMNRILPDDASEDDIPPSPKVVTVPNYIRHQDGSCVTYNIKKVQREKNGSRSISETWEVPEGTPFPIRVLYDEYLWLMAHAGGMEVFRGTMVHQAYQHKHTKTAVLFFLINHAKRGGLKPIARNYILHFYTKIEAASFVSLVNAFHLKDESEEATKKMASVKVDNGENLKTGEVEDVAKVVDCEQVVEDDEDEYYLNHDPCEETQDPWASLGYKSDSD